MRMPYGGAIDCDLHVAAPTIAELLPFLDDYWRDQLVNRAIDRMPFAMMSYPPNAPISMRADWRSTPAATPLETLRAQALDPFGVQCAIVNVIHGCVALHHDDMAAALCRAVNDWLRVQWLDREPRLRVRRNEAHLLGCPGEDFRRPRLSRSGPLRSGRFGARRVRP